MARRFVRSALAATLLSLTLVVALSGQEVKAGKKYALLVGVQQYSEGTKLRNLEYTEKDMNDLATVLKKQGYEVTVMTWTAATEGKKNFLFPTAKKINEQLRAIAEGCKAEDTVLVAFTGHGAHLKSTDKLYFCPQDTDLADEKSLVAVDDVMATLGKSKAGAKVLLMDACRNDPADGATGGTPGELKSASMPLSPDPPGGTVALFSCSKGQISHESAEFKRGFLFHHVIEGLGGKAKNKSGEVTWLSLASYVSDELPGAVRKDKGPTVKQTPEVKGQARGAMVLAKYEGAAAVEEPKPMAKIDSPGTTDAPKAAVGGYDLTGGHRFVQFGAGGSVHVAVTVYDGEKKRWAAYVLDPLNDKKIAGPFNPEGQVDEFAFRPSFSPDGTSILTAVDTNKEAAVWKAATGEKIAGPFKHKDRIQQAAFSPDGLKVVTSGLDKTASVWEVETGKRCAGPFEHGDAVTYSTFSPDSSRVATASIDGTVIVWNVHSGKKIATMKHDNGIEHLSFSPDGLKVATATVTGPCVWDARSGEKRSAGFPEGSRAGTVVFSPDGSRLLTSETNEAKTATLRDAVSGKVVGAPFRHLADVGRAVFSPDGKRIVTISHDQVSAVWDAATGELRGSTSGTIKDLNKGDVPSPGLE